MTSLLQDLRYGRRQLRRSPGFTAVPQQVLVQFLSLGARLLLVGIALGLLGAWAAGRAMQSVPFGVSAFPPGVLATTAGTMIFVVLLACIIPARRAAKVDPRVALRYE